MKFKKNIFNFYLKIDISPYYPILIYLTNIIDYIVNFYTNKTINRLPYSSFNNFLKTQ